MKIRKGTAFALLTVLLSCTAKNDASIQLAAICMFPEDAKQCKFSNSCEALLMNRPWVATRRTSSTWGDTMNSLDLAVQIDNQLPLNENESLFRNNTNDFTIEEFRLSYSSPQISLAPRSFRLNQLVPATGSTVSLVKLIPEQAMAVIDAADLTTLYVSRWAENARVDVTIKAFGHTRDGREIETEGWTVPVDVFDVDVPGTTGVNRRFFDPVCTGTTTTVTGVCPHGAQTATTKCE